MGAQVSEGEIKRLESLIALALARSAGSSGGGGLASFFVWQPNGTAGEGVYITPQSLAAALLKVKGRKIVTVDTSNGAAHLTMAGAPYNLNDVDFVAGIGTTLALITVDSGVTFTSTTKNLGLENVALETTGGGTVWAPPADAVIRGYVAEIVCAAGAPLVDVAGQVNFEGVDFFMGDGTNPVALIENGGQLFGDLLSSEFNNNAFAQGTAPGGLVTVNLDGSSGVGPTQGAGLTITIDQLGVNAKEAFAAVDSGAVTSVKVTTNPLTRIRTGAIDVAGFIGGSNSAAATISVTLERDAAVIATYPPIVQAGAGAWAASLAITDLITDDTGHTYTIHAATSAGTIDVVGNADKTLSNGFVEAREQ